MNKWILPVFALLSSCGSGNVQPRHPPPVDVNVMTIETVDAPVVYQFVGQAKSSLQVEIRARVDGFLDKLAYEEGEMVEKGQILFELDKKPYEAALQKAKGELALQQARLDTASANLKRIRPLAEQDAVSKKDLDDAIGSEKAAQAAVLAAAGTVDEAQLNLGYATIYSPLKGLASKTDKQVGSYIPTGQDSLLTYVAQLDPIWINFSISENQALQFNQDVASGTIIPPEEMKFEVEVILANGASHPYWGTITFSEPNIDPNTGTFLIRAELKNPEGNMRPGQFVRVNLHGAKRPNAILVPQKAVVQGSKGHFVWVVGKDNHPQVRSVEVGPWQGNNWFIEQGLQPGDLVIIDNLMKLNPEKPIKVNMGS
ncbi:Efflux pump periplasmic linker BepD [Waddlia chondrophila 2032/99]|uniref:Efflux pump periplasmic linker BepD n=1 Tax=Waddlia chondrophila 2032/99 TaxID=765953 RepID=F8LEL0_9BACT|nr:Efflux pump periplasmic linker BepD [Waddlia chondrophila 2032/99]